MGITHYLSIIGCSVAVYLFIIIGIRLSGKKEVSQLSIVDLVFILLISNAVQNAMVGPDTSLVGGLTAAAALFILNALLRALLVRFPRFGRLLQGQPIMLIYKGKLFVNSLQRAGLTLDELKEAIREHGVFRVEEVDLAVLEMDGNISVLSHEFSQKTVKKRKLRRGSVNVSQG